MKSPLTGREMKLMSEPSTLNYRGKQYNVNHHFYLCELSNEQFTTTELDELNLEELNKQVKLDFLKQFTNIEEKINITSLYEGKDKQTINMKILVTGGAGFIGTNLIKRLLDEGHNVSSLDNYDSGLVENEIEGCNYHRGDIEQISLMDKDFDLIYHLAGRSRIQYSFITPDETFRVNTIGTQKVCEFAKEINAKVVYAGSSSQWHEPLQSPYATTKFLGEQLIKMYKKVYECNFEICRFYNVYGPNEIINGDWAAVIGIWRRQIMNNEKITIIGDGNQRRDFTHVIDIVDALYKVGMSNEKHKDAWELGTGKNHSINEVYEMFNENIKCDKIYVPNQKGNYLETLRENNDAIDRLGWEPKDRLKEYIHNLYSN
jgi:UDP-glucose 4-epimerase